MAFPLLALGALGLAAAGAAGAAGAGASGVGKTTYRASNFADTKHYDPNRFEWGGLPGGADADARRMRWWADNAQTRGAEQADYTLANNDRARGLQARIGQQQAANLMMRRAQGLVPSIAEQQAARQMQQATAAQASQAASARGAAGLALAQQNAANNTATMQSAISNQAQINAAQERMAAEQAAFGAYSGLRGGDLASQQQVAQQAQFQAQLNAAQRAQNDAMTLGMTQHELAIRQAQLGAGIQQQGLLAGQHTAAQGINAGVNQANAGREMEFLKLGLGMAQGGAQTGITIGQRASGGPVAAGQPYLVGELGPELIVPASDGTVIPSDMTMGLLGASGGRGPASGPATPSIDRVRGDGSLDVLGSLRAHSRAATRYATDPTGGMRGGLFG